MAVPRHEAVARVFTAIGHPSVAEAFLAGELACPGFNDSFLNALAAKGMIYCVLIYLFIYIILHWPAGPFVVVTEIRECPRALFNLGA